MAFAVCLAMGGHWRHTAVAACSISASPCSPIRLVALRAGRFGLAAAGGTRPPRGVGAALIVPQILATLHASLSGHAHSRALAAYGCHRRPGLRRRPGAGGFLGSADIGGLGWRSVFLINLPICLGILPAAAAGYQETRAEHAAAVNAPGTAARRADPLLLLPLALGPSLHWSWPCASAAGGGGCRCWPGCGAPGCARTPPGLAVAAAVAAAPAEHPLRPVAGDPVLRLLERLDVRPRPGPAGRRRLSPVQAGNAFIALGASYFVSALLTARVAARDRPVRLLLLGCVIQMSGLLGLMLTLQRVWPQPGILNLAPATLVIGFGQAFIVSSFFRIGLSGGAGRPGRRRQRHARHRPAGLLGLGSALLGAVFAHRLERHGDYLEADADEPWPSSSS
ncbi:hypothetical protein P4233_12805 [Pseudomonas aeruginosa]|nr:hypothetical protein [Pseudomonas aeruginosa]